MQLEIGTLSERLAESQICDPGVDQSSSYCPKMNQFVKEFDCRVRSLEETIKKYQASVTCQRDICSIENAVLVCPQLAAKAETKGQREMEKLKFTPPIEFIDLTSEDSGGSSISKKDAKHLDFAEVQSPISPCMGIGVRSPPLRPAEESPSKRRRPDPPEIQELAVKISEQPTLLSDDDDDEIGHEPYVWSSAQAQDEDELADVWEEMRRALEAESALEPPRVLASQSWATIEPLKVKANDVVSDISYQRDVIQSTFQMALEVKESLQGTTPKVQRSRSTKKSKEKLVEVAGPATITSTKETKERLVEAITSTKETKESLTGPSVIISSKETKERLVEFACPSAITSSPHDHGVEERKKRKVKVKKVEQMLVLEGDQVKSKFVKEKEITGLTMKKSIRKEQEKGGKRKETGEELQEDEEDEDEFGHSGKSNRGAEHEEQMKVSPKLDTGVIDYEPYYWKNKKDVDEDDRLLEDLFNEMTMAMASTLDASFSGTSPENKDCDHNFIAFSDGIKQFCMDCGVMQCDHKIIKFSDEHGRSCEICGLVLQDIQNLYVPSEVSKATRKQHPRREEDTVDEVSEVNLLLQEFTMKEDFCGVELHLHPFFEEHLHPHQKTGYNFLKKNLLGDRENSCESLGCVLAHAPGTGKTCLIISFIQSFLARFPSGRPLILAPKIMLNSWESEFGNWEVEEITLYNLNESINSCTQDSIQGEGPLEGDEEDEEDDTRLPSHLKKTLKECRIKMLSDWKGGRGVLLMSYNLFSILVSKGLEETVLSDSLESQISKLIREGPNLVILDEGHLARNMKTKISKSLMSMETRRRVLLSGTLFQNNFKELYTLLKLCRDDFMMSHPEYRKRIEAACNLHGSKYDDGGSQLQLRSKKELMQIEEKLFTEEIGEKLESYVKSGEVRTEEIKSVVLKLQSLTASFVNWYPGEILKSLPGLFEYSIHLNLTVDQQQALSELTTGNQRSHISHMSRQCMALQACMHPSLVNRGESVDVSNTSLQEAHRGVKIRFLHRLVALCSKADEKVLIFCTTLGPLTYIEEFFSKIFFCWQNGKQVHWQKGQHILRLDGTMGEFERQRVIDQFNAKEHESHVLLASTKACKEGITLVGASRVVIIDNPDNPSVVRQAVSRAFRIGQKRKVFVYRLVTTSREEEDIFRRSVNKERLSQVLLDPVSTIAKMGGFLRELCAHEVEDGILREMLEVEKEIINLVYRYNAAGRK